MPKTRIALVGAGGIANYHFGHLKQMDDVQVVAISDVEVEKARKMAAECGAKAYADYHEMYDAGGFDGVFICVPPFAHTDQELLAAEKGYHFFVEKPQALSMDLARKVEAVVERAGVITAVGFQDRYQDIIDDLREYLKGRGVRLIHGAWMGGMPGVPWWRRREMSGGQHVEQTIHIFDTARYLFGDVESVSAAAAAGLMTNVENYNVDDASAVTLRFKNGIVGVIFSACYLRGRRAGKSGLEVFCQDSRVEYRLRSSVAYHTDTEVRERFRQNDNGMSCDRTFIEAIQRGDGSGVRSPYKDANRTLAITLAASESLASGGQVVPIR